MEIINAFLSDQLLNALGWTIIHSLWQASLIALIMSVYLKRYHKEKSIVRYRIALSSLYIMLAISIVTFALYYFNYNSYTAELTLSTTYLNPTIANANLYIQDLTFGLVHHFDFITTMWLSGMVIFSFKFLGGFLYLKKFTASAFPVIDNKVLVVMDDLLDKLNINRSVQLFESAKVSTPMMLGHFKPMILLPIGIINQLELNEVEAILAHELSHISRNDFLQNIFQSLIEIIYYYHPAIWWISANVRSERENCCDEEAIRLCGSAVDYARTLVKIEELQSMQMPSLAITLARSKSNLFSRISRILDQPYNRNQIKEKLVATLLLFSVITLFGETNNHLHAFDKLHIDNEVFVKNYKPHNFKISEANEDMIKSVVIHSDDLHVIVDTIPNKTSDCNEIDIHSTKDGKSFKLKINGAVLENFEINGEKVEHPELYFPENDQITKTEDGTIIFKIKDKDNIEEEKYRSYRLDEIEKDEILKAPFKLGGSVEGINEELFEVKKIEEILEQRWPLSKDHQKHIKENKIELLKQLESISENSIKIKEALPEIFRNEDFAKVFEHENFSFENLNNHSNFPQHTFSNIDHHSLLRGLHSSPSDQIFNVLLQDGFIDSNRENEIELTGDYMKINGEKQASNIWRKYKRLYEKHLGHELSKGSKVILKERTEEKHSFIIGQ